MLGGFLVRKASPPMAGSLMVISLLAPTLTLTHRVPGQVAESLQPWALCKYLALCFPEASAALWTQVLPGNSWSWPRLTPRASDSIKHIKHIVPEWLHGLYHGLGAEEGDTEGPHWGDDDDDDWCGFHPSLKLAPALPGVAPNPD